MAGDESLSCPITPQAVQAGSENASVSALTESESDALLLESFTDEQISVDSGPPILKSAVALPVSPLTCHTRTAFVKEISDGFFESSQL